MCNTAGLVLVRIPHPRHLRIEFVCEPHLLCACLRSRPANNRRTTASEERTKRRAVRAEIQVWLYICLLAWHVMGPEGLEHRPCTVMALYLVLHARDRVLRLTLPPLRLLLRIAAEHRPLHTGASSIQRVLGTHAALALPWPVEFLPVVFLTQCAVARSLREPAASDRVESTPNGPN